MGVEGHLVDVEAHVADGLPRFALVGLPDASLNEAPDRVRAACSSQGVPLPYTRITVNLSPASLPKTGSGFDLAIAMATLAATGTVDEESVAEAVHLGELGLDGRLRPIRGILPAVRTAVDDGARRVVVPWADRDEAMLVPGADVVPAVNLADVVRCHGGPSVARALPEPGSQDPVLASTTYRANSPGAGDLRDVVGQPTGRRGVEVAASGGHHLLMIGPPGAGKTMLASRLPGLLPDLAEQDAVAVTAVHSLSGTLDATTGLITRPPFEEPHHTASVASVIGGGSGVPRPGAASRAHRGVLFLDEAPEFRAGILDALRQPLESGELVIARTRATVRFPARFQLVLAANPCPCGRNVGKGLDCTCSPMVRRRYSAKLTGPVLDRVDLRIEVSAPSRADLQAGADGESSEVVRDRVLRARWAQARRWAEPRWANWQDQGPWAVNSQVPGQVLRDGLRLPPRATREVDRAVDQGRLTLRGYDRVLRVAWTLADLDGSTCPTGDHVAEALRLRSMSWAA